MSVKNRVLAAVLAATILVSMFLSSLPLVRADYHVDHASFPPDLPGDVTCDGKVSGDDLIIVAKAFGSYFGGGGLWDPRADLNDEGKVTGDDLIQMAKLFGTAYNTSTKPIAYSTSFEFDVPSTGVSGVWYYMLVRIYMPSGLTSNTSFLVGNASAGIQNVIIDTKLVYPSQVSGPFNVSLGSLTQGYHLVELEYEGPAGGGSISLAVQTSAGEAVQLDRFRICVPNYTNAMIDYSVNTNTYFSGDDFFLGGLADKFIDNVWLDSKSLWPEWMWDSGSVLGGVGTIYGWGDGFMYPLGTPNKGVSHRISFIFGNNATGLLDFQYISRSSQPDKIGQPKFFASAGISNLSPYVTLNVENIRAGSQWAGNPGISERNVTLLTSYNASYNDGTTWFDTSIGITFGNWWATWELGGSQPPDIAIPLNFTVADFASNLWTGLSMDGSYADVYVCLKDYTIDIYSFQQLILEGIENPDAGQSQGIIAHDYSIALNFVGNAIMTAAAISFNPAVVVVGSIVGLGFQGVSAVLDYVQGQSVSQPRYNTVSGNNHEQLQAKAPIALNVGTRSSCSLSQSDLIFLRFQPNNGYQCGLTEVVLTGTVAVEHAIQTSLGEVDDFLPIGSVQITLCIPWFIWSLT